MKSLQIIFLTYNEEDNIGRSLANIMKYGFENILVLDSGSTDETEKIVNSFNIQVQQHIYNDHCSTYNRLTSNKEYDYYMILDADMYFSEELSEHVKRIMIEDSEIDVYAAKVQMYHEGHPLKYGSLYPDKPILFKARKEYFVRSGHGEKLSTANVSLLSGLLFHDDRKKFEAVLNKQLKYINKAYEIFQNEIPDAISPKKDQLRFSSPIWIFVSVLYSYIFKLGFLSGKIGVLYSLDRLITELLYYRKGLVNRINNKKQNKSL